MPVYDPVTADPLLDPPVDLLLGTEPTIVDPATCMVDIATTHPIDSSEYIITAGVSLTSSDCCQQGVANYNYDSSVVELLKACP